MDMRNGTKGFSGTFSINGGTVLADGGNVGTGNLTLNGGVLEHYWGVDFTRTLGAGAGQVQILGGASGFSENGAGHSVILNNNAAFVVVWGSAYFNPSALVLQAATAQSSSYRNAALTFQNILDLNGSNRTVRVDQIPTAGVDPNGATLSGAIRNTNAVPAGLIKTGVGKLTLSAINTYDGDTKVEAGTLKLAGSSTLPDGAALWVADGAKVDLAAGVNETVKNLYVNGESVDAGTWGSSASGAGHVDDAHFAGSGVLTVLERVRKLTDAMILIVR
jgi:autotransporter-associated beta strand protein